MDGKDNGEAKKAKDEMARISDPISLATLKIEIISLAIVTILESLVKVANSTLIVVTERNLLIRIILTKNQLVVSPVGSSRLDRFCVSKPPTYVVLRRIVCVFSVNYVSGPN